MILPPKVSCENSTKANIGHAFSRRLVCREARASQEALSANPTKQTYIQYKLNTERTTAPQPAPLRDATTIPGNGLYAFPRPPCIDQQCNLSIQKE